MNTDNFTAEKNITGTSSISGFETGVPVPDVISTVKDLPKPRKKIYLVRMLCLLLFLSCAVTGVVPLVVVFKSTSIFVAVVLVFAAIVVCTALIVCEICRTEQYMKLYLDGNDSLNLIRFHYSESEERLISERQNYIPRNIQQEENRRKAQYLALQNQINPHFLYNTLEAIRSEAVIGGLLTIADMSETLANFFRYTISNTSGLVTLADEIKNVQDYFTIQRFRFGERIDLRIQIPMDGPLQFYRLPKLILQPIVENAIIHGLEDRIKGGLITIAARTTQNKLFITIEDNGKGMQYNKLLEINRNLGMQIRPDVNTGKHTGIAVYNVNDRLRLLYGKDFGLTYFSMPQIGTTVEIVLPNTAGKES